MIALFPGEQSFDQPVGLFRVDAHVPCMDSLSINVLLLLQYVTPPEGDLWRD